MAQTFMNADIVIGPHGAGLSNFALVPEGSVLVELKSSFHRASDVFKKIAQGRGGGHLWVNTEASRDPNSGQTLDADTVRNVVRCALALWHRGQRQRGGGIMPAATEARGDHGPCACRPVGGGVSKGTVRTGIFGYAAVGHSEECGLHEPTGACHAGTVTNWTGAMNQSCGLES